MEWLLDKVKGDRILWAIVFLLSLFSVLAVYSSTGTLAYKMHAGNTEFYLFKQLFFIGLGLVMMYFAHLVPYKYYSRAAQILLYISIPLLIYTLIFGTNINEAKRWITLPFIGITFQTSDLAKLALIMYVARILSKKQENIKDFHSAFLPIMMPPLIICGLIAPANLSTACVLFATCLILMFIGRVNLIYIFIMMMSAIFILGMIVLILLNSPNQGRVGTWKSRVEDFMNKEETSYQTQQAKIAIAKGGIIGQGPGKSTQRNFLPSPYSDFIYAIIIEEYGLIGGSAIILLYLIFLFRSIKIFIKTPKAFGALLAVGLSFSLVIQAMINLGVTVNILPVTGLTLPLVSMGGSSLWFTSIAVGIILSVSRDVDELKKEERENIIEQKNYQMAVGSNSGSHVTA